MIIAVIRKILQFYHSLNPGRMYITLLYNHYNRTETAPYMIQRRKDQEAFSSFVCVIDNLYKISVYIKMDTKQFEEIIISFHEDNKRGIARPNRIQGYSNMSYQSLIPLLLVI